MHVRLGNNAAKDTSGEWPGQRITTVTIPESYSLSEAFKCITDANGVWVNHSDAPPMWVSCPESPAFEALLADALGCPVGAPPDDELERDYHTDSGPPEGLQVPEDLSALESPEA